MKEKKLIQEKWYQKTNSKIALVLVIGLCIFGYFALQTSSDPCKKIKKPILTEIDKNSINIDCMNNITTLSSGLIIEDLKIGDGAEIKSGDSITMDYTGTLAADGKKFDSSEDRNEPFVTNIGVGKVIKGWDQGVPGMKVGGERKLTIPPALGYGAQGIGPIPPNATLIFTVKALGVN